MVEEVVQLAVAGSACDLGAADTGEGEGAADGGDGDGDGVKVEEL